VEGRIHPNEVGASSKGSEAIDASPSTGSAWKLELLGEIRALRACLRHDMRVIDAQIAATFDPQYARIRRAFRSAAGLPLE